MSWYDLIVIGAGPGGSSAAILAARKGARVLLLERGAFPRHKVCGEFVSAESLDLLETLLGRAAADLVTVALRIGRARLFLDGHLVENSITPSAASIARYELDAALWNAAKSSGVATQARITVNAVRNDGAFRIMSSAGEFSAAAVIDASGRWSNLGSHAQGNKFRVTEVPHFFLQCNAAPQFIEFATLANHDRVGGGVCFSFCFACCHRVSSSSKEA